MRFVSGLKDDVTIHLEFYHAHSGDVQVRIDRGGCSQPLLTLTNHGTLVKHKLTHPIDGAFKLDSIGRIFEEPAHNEDGI